MSTLSSPPPATGGLRRVAKLFNPLSAPLAGRRWFTLWALIDHTGRRSGRAYATPVAVRRTTEGFVIPVPFGDGTHWVRNVIEAGGATIHWNGAEYRVTDPTLVGWADVSSAFNRVMRAIVRRVGMDRFLRVRVAD